ncbi:MAG: sugar transferase [Deltaproteobacteria bacterium]|nr:sugar transferase [Deltaproteobacteria bacterium]
MSYKYFKRHFDLIGSILLIIIALPIFAVIALFIFFKGGLPILFRQRRPGLDGRPFILYKFRTMVEKRNSQNKQLADVDRLPVWGRILREMSLDELPELWNVLKGEMSLVGPRPLLLEYLEYYTPEQTRRHEVKPGMTGWAQVNGRNALNWKRKFELDLWYIDHLSFGLDLKIVGLSLLKIIKREGISQPGCVTAEKFRGE